MVKTICILFLIGCVQTAMLPFCPCPQMVEDAVEAACCHAPVNSEDVPCPHCDRADSLELQFPPKSIDGPPNGDLYVQIPKGREEGLESLEAEVRDSERVRFTSVNPPPVCPLHVCYGVFLI